jgi:hypothetical protein
MCLFFQLKDVSSCMTKSERNGNIGWKCSIVFGLN